MLLRNETFLGDSYVKAGLSYIRRPANGPVAAEYEEEKGALEMCDLGKRAGLG